MNGRHPCLAWVVLVAAAPVTTADTIDSFLLGEAAIQRSAWHAVLPAAKAPGYIEDPQLRISPEVDANDVHSATYRVRFRPVGRRERRAARELFAVENTLATYEWQSAQDRALTRRYHQVIGLAKTEVEHTLAQARHALTQSLLDAQRTGSQPGDTDRIQALALLLGADRREAQRLTRLRDSARTATVGAALAVSRADTPQITPVLATPSRIAQALEHIDATRTPRVLRAQAEITRAQSAAALTDARSRIGINLIELGYESKGVASQGITLGIRLPFGQRTMQRRRSARDVNVARAAARAADANMHQQLDMAHDTLAVLIAHYADQRLDLTELSRQAPPDTITAAARLARYRLDLYHAIADTHAEILHAYVDVLALSGAMAKSPLRNWIKGNAT